MSLTTIAAILTLFMIYFLGTSYYEAYKRRRALIERKKRADKLEKR